MKVSVIISICDGRLNMFRRSLITWSKQTMLKDDFEIIVVDDENRLDIKKLCESFDLNFQYIRIDNNKSIFPIKTFLPILSNNVGFKQALGEVVVITGPETLQAENNLQVAYSFNKRKECAYGLVYRSNQDFMNYINKNWNDNMDFKSLLKIKGAKADCRTKPPHPPAYWYIMAVAKEHVENIRGVDESFACGICAEDDDFANRMRLSGVIPVFEHQMVGIHQDHSSQDLLDSKHSFRNTPEGIKLRQLNISLMRKNLINRNIKVNKLDKSGANYDPNYTWGDPRVIIEHIKFRGGSR